MTQINTASVDACITLTNFPINIHHVSVTFGIFECVIYYIANYRRTNKVRNAQTNAKTNNQTETPGM